jgi:DNA-binding MarR family transcriptional regulator
MAHDDGRPVLPTGESFGHNLRQTNRLIQRALAVRIAPLGLSIGQWYALRTLWEEEGLTQIELAQKSGIAGPAMVSAVRGLLAQGLVTRHRPRGDRRKYLIVLTDAGRALETPGLRAAVQANEAALDGVSPTDAATCLRVLRQAFSNLGARGEMPADAIADRLNDAGAGV